MSSGVGSTTSNGSDTGGLVTAFTVVPEPSTCALLLGSAALLAGRRRIGRSSPA